MYSHIGINIAIIATTGVVSFSQCGTWFVNSATISGRNNIMGQIYPVTEKVDQLFEQLEPFFKIIFVEKRNFGGVEC